MQKSAYREAAAFTFRSSITMTTLSAPNSLMTDSAKHAERDVSLIYATSYTQIESARQRRSSFALLSRRMMPDALNLFLTLRTAGR